MRIGWLWRREKDMGAAGAGDWVERLAQELDGVGSEFRHLHTLPLARAVEKAWTPDGLSREQLATLIGANRGMSPAQALTVLRAGD
jgi:hypothetical protein